jgi:hypothetical protein
MVTCLAAIVWTGLEGMAHAQLLLMYGMLMMAWVHEMFTD